MSGTLIVRSEGGASDLSSLGFPGNIDNAGRVEVANNIALGEYVMDVDNLPLFFDQEDIGTGSQSYNASIAGQDLEVTSNLDRAIFQTKQWHPYFPGHAQQAEFTFVGLTPETNVIKRVGYFSSSTTTPFSASRDGLWLESRDGTVYLAISKSGTTTYIAQANWTDPLDGTGASGITTDWDNFQVFQVDFLYLGGTYVNLYYVAEGGRHHIHRYDHANSFATTIMNTPSQPIRAEIESTGGAGSFTFVCAQVSTLGGGSELAGVPVAIDTDDLVSLTTADTEYAVLGLRKNTRQRELFLQNAGIVSTAGAATAFIWRVHINPTLSAGLSYSAIANTGFDGAIGTGSETVSSIGHVLFCDVGSARSTTTVLGLTKALRIGQEIAGTSDELVLTVQPTSNNQDVVAAMTGISV